MGLAALSARSGEVSWRWCLVAGIAARFILLPAPWFTSNDLFRYLWDGAAVLHGHDPWSESPLALAEGIDSPQPLPPDNTTVPSIYPPGAR